MKYYYCKNCDKIVGASMTKRQIVIFVILLCLGIIPGAIYFACCGKTCPYCGIDIYEVDEKDIIWEDKPKQRKARGV